MAADDYSPEKAGVGGSTPSRGTVKSISYRRQNPKTCSKFVPKQNPGPAEVFLSDISIEAGSHSFTTFLKVPFAEQITRDSRAFKKTVLRFVRRELPPKQGRPDDPQLDAARLHGPRGRKDL